jgi:subtilase family serine protease
MKLDGTRAVPALVAGASHSGTTMVTMPAGLGPGGYYLFAKADGTESLPEAREQNNTLVRMVYLGPDLVMLGLSSVAPTKAGTSVQVGDTVSNSGGGNAGGFVVRFYLSTNIVLDATDTQLDGSRSIVSLSAGTNSSGSTAVAIPLNTSPANYYLIAKVDADNAIAEVSEGNNTAVRLIQVTQ